jgi:hypothetical protein
VLANPKCTIQISIQVEPPMPTVEVSCSIGRPGHAAFPANSLRVVASASQRNRHRTPFPSISNRHRNRREYHRTRSIRIRKAGLVHYPCGNITLECLPANWTIFPWTGLSVDGVLSTGSSFPKTRFQTRGGKSCHSNRGRRSRSSRKGHSGGGSELGRSYYNEKGRVLTTHGYSC